MESHTRSEVTGILADLASGNASGPAAWDRLFHLVYDDLRGVAGNLFRKERVNHTLQPTALVHEAYMRLVDAQRIDWQGKAHFLAVSAKVMRRVLVEHARKHNAAKRGGDQQRITLDEELQVVGDSPLAVIELDDALSRFAALDERASRVVELRVFGGLSVKEAAEVLGVSPRTVDQDWSVARMWLARELGPQEG